MGSAAKTAPTKRNPAYSIAWLIDFKRLLNKGVPPAKTPGRPDCRAKQAASSPPEDKAEVASRPSRAIKPPLRGVSASLRGSTMKLSRRAALALPFAALVVSAALAEDSADNTVILTTKEGKVTIKLRPDLAPKHVAQIKALVNRKFYDGIVFHRVIPGFMAQTGDPTGTGTGGSDLPNVPAEFTDTPFKRGTVGMARASDPDSANSQFFICFADASFLNGKYTVL